LRPSRASLRFGLFWRRGCLERHDCSVLRFLTAFLIVLTSTMSALSADEPVAASDPFQLPKLPPVEFSHNLEWYPARARFRGLEGRVLVAFDITSAGSAQKISILWTEDALLASSAEQMLSKAHFKIPTDWQTSGAWRRWRLGFIYCLPPSSQPEEFGVPVETVLITGSRIRGSPQNHPPDPNSASRCVKQPRLP
jgi:TonB family protein